MRIVKTAPKLCSCILSCFVIVGACLCASPYADAFELPLYIEIHNADDIYQLLEDEIITEDVAESLLELIANPIELNKADVDELLMLPSITQTEAEAIVNQWKQLRGFKRWSDLLRIQGFDRAKLRQLESFAYIRPPLDRFDGKAELSLSEAANDGKSYYSRLLVRTDVDERCFFGLSNRREDDEIYRWDKRTPPQPPLKEGGYIIEPPGWRADKFYALWRGKGLVNQVILGNYSAGFGAGLVFNDAHRLAPKGIYTDDTILFDRQRGAALVLSWKSIQPTIFFSGLDYPAVLPPQTSGLKSQRRINDVYSEKLLGTDISFKLPRDSKLGFTWYRSFIDKHLNIPFENLPNRERWSAYGLHFRTSVIGFYLRGEASQTINAGRALYLELSKKLQFADFLASFRRYDVDFDNPHSHGFADDDDSLYGNVDGDIDETGIYIRMQYRPNRKFSLRTYYDQWRHPSTHIMDNEAHAEAEYNFSRTISLGISGKWDDDDLSARGNERFGGLLWTRLNPIPPFSSFLKGGREELHITTVYRFFHIQRADTTYDDYAYLKLEWYIRKWLELEARWKINDTKFTEGDTFPKEWYLQFQIGSLRSPTASSYGNKSDFGGRIRYTQTYYGSASRVTTNPKNYLFLRLEYRW